MKRITTLLSALMLTCFSAVAQNYWYVGATLPTAENFQAIATQVSDYPETYEDLTARVGVTAEDWHAGGSVPDWAAPEVITYDGRKTPLAEVYEETTETTGTVMEQTITGLPIGSYQVTLYANAYYTPDRGFDSDITEGQDGVVYVYANNEKI